jgi:ABC-2 type transport system ATP-binding protein
MTSQKNKKAVVTNGLSVAYSNVAAVDRVSVSLGFNEILFLLGPNGAGKSTLMKLICGLLVQDSGTVTVMDQTDCGSGSRRCMAIGYCPQQLSIWRDLTCNEQLTFMAKMYGMSVRKRKKIIPFLLNNLNLRDRKNQLAGHLSGGKQRALNLALSMVHDPDILILDEPFAGIDIESRYHLREVLQTLAHVNGKGILISTHNLDEAEKMADRVAIMDKGVLLASGSPKVLKGDAGRSLEDVFMGLTGRRFCP